MGSTALSVAKFSKCSNNTIDCNREGGNGIGDLYAMDLSISSLVDMKKTRHHAYSLWRVFTKNHPS